jgi:hypothetical protein
VPHNAALEHCEVIDLAMARAFTNASAALGWDSRPIRSSSPVDWQADFGGDRDSSADNRLRMIVSVTKPTDTPIACAANHGLEALNAKTMGVQSKKGASDCLRGAVKS